MDTHTYTNTHTHTHTHTYTYTHTHTDTHTHSQQNQEQCEEEEASWGMRGYLFMPQKSPYSSLAITVTVDEGLGEGKIKKFVFASQV